MQRLFWRKRPIGGCKYIYKVNKLLTGLDERHVGLTTPWEQQQPLARLGVSRLGSVTLMSIGVVGRPLRGENSYQK